MNDIYVGIDLGGTNIKFGLFSETGELYEKWQVPTDDKNIDAISGRIVREVRTHAETSGYRMEDIKAVGMGVPGSVNRQGIILDAPNLGWKMTDGRELSAQWPDLPLFVANDANVAALGEQAYGTGANCNSMIFVTLGTGVGGGVIMDGNLVAGCFGGAGEIGHMTVNLKEENMCSCGKFGCLEQYASATGIVRMARLRLAKEEEPSRLRHVEELTAREIFDAVRDNDGLAVRVAEDFGNILGRACAMMAAVVDPEMFVIGGGVSAAGELLLGFIRKYYVRYAFTPSVNTPFKIASLGNDAGIYGAARMAILQSVRKI